MCEFCKAGWFLTPKLERRIAIYHNAKFGIGPDPQSGAVSIGEPPSSSINYFQCGIYYRSDGSRGRRNLFYIIGVFASFMMLR